MNDDKSKSNVPGRLFPEKDTNFPGQTKWAFMGLFIGLLAGGLLGGGIYQLLLILDPKTANTSYLFGIGTTYVTYKAAQEWLISKGAVSYYNLLAEQEPEKLLYSYIQAGLWKADNKDYLGAIVYIKKALSKSPEYRDAIVVYATVLWKSNKLQETLDLLEPWLANNEDFMGEIIAAEASKKALDHVRAVKHFQKALELFPETPKRSDIVRYISEHNKAI